MKNKLILSYFLVAYDPLPLLKFLTQQFDRPACEHATGKPSIITAWFYEWFKTNVRPASRSHSNDSWFKRATPARKKLRQK